MTIYFLIQQKQYAPIFWQCYFTDRAVVVVIVW